MTNPTNNLTDKEIQELEAGLVVENNRQCLAEAVALADIEQALLADMFDYIQASGKGAAARIVALNKGVA